MSRKSIHRAATEAAAAAGPKDYTPEKLERAVNKYFMSITRRVVRKEMVPTGERDNKGHMIYEQSPILNSLGKAVEITEYILPPSVTDLCQALGIRRSTWTSYCDHQLHPELTDLTERTCERIRAWNERELLTRPGKDIKGIMFNLQSNYGYGGEKREVELGPGARKALHSAPVSERAAMLKELLDELRREEYDSPREAGGACEDVHG